MSAAGQRGSASILMLAVGLVILATGLGCTALGGAIAARHAAESAADLAALAGAGRIGVADDSCQVAAQIAQANRATLTDCLVMTSPDGRSGDVLVSVRRSAQTIRGMPAEARATARAARLP